MLMSPKEITKEEIQRIYETKTYLLNHLHKKFTIRQLARKAAIGEQRFKDGFAFLFGMAVGEYIHEARMQTAKLLLRNTKKSIKEISLLCGYRQARNFSSAHKMFFRIKPREHR